jgi:signal transduction histidine kinase
VSQEQVRTLLDVAAGLSLLVIAWLLPDRLQRLRVLCVAAVWALGWVSPELVALQRGAVALLILVSSATFPSGRRGRDAALAGIALALCLPGLPPLVAALGFVGVALSVRVVPGARARTAATAAGVLAAVELAMAAAVAIDGSWGQVTSTAYVVAVPLCCWFVSSPGAATGALRRVAPDEAELEGDPFLATARILSRALHDPLLVVSPAGEGAGTVVDVRGAPWAVVKASPGVLSDHSTRGAVTTAVRLVGEHAALVAELRERAVELAASRGALLDAADRERAAIGPALERSVLRPLDAACVALDGEAALAAELRRATEEIQAILAGYPPVPLGDGKLVAALGSVGQRWPILVHRRIEATFRADQSVEAVLYAVASEAVTNAAKHAGASLVQITLGTRDGWATLSVLDDGAGGARPDGHGLSTLRLRVETRGGRIRVADRPAGGTLVVARVPIGAAVAP